MSSFDPNAILKSRVGILRLAAIGVGLFAVAFCGAGHDYQKDWRGYRDLYIKVRGNSKELDCPLPDPDNNNVRDEGFGRCAGPWAGELGIALIIIAWLFTIAMLIVSALPSLSENPIVRMVDGFGHIGAGVLAILGGLLSIWWTINLWLAGGCDRTQYKSGGKTYDVKPEVTKRCNDAVFFVPETCEVAREGFLLCGFKGWLWIAGGVFAIGAGVVCIVIFVMLKKAGPRGPMMMGGMMTQQPSQAPMSMHPSQMTQQQQQQQNPDQQSVHPSQMTQQQG